MRPAWTDSSTRGSRSTPITDLPQSANVSASGSPTRPSPMIATLPVTSAPPRARYDGCRALLVVVVGGLRGRRGRLLVVRVGPLLGVAEPLLQQRQPLGQHLRL